jgi:hypothetical protein
MRSSRNEKDEEIGEKCARKEEKINLKADGK